MLSGSNEKRNDPLNKSAEEAVLIAENVSSQILSSVNGLLSNLLSANGLFSTISQNTLNQLNTQHFIPTFETTENHIQVKLNGQLISEINLAEIKEQTSQIIKNTEI